VPWNLAVCALLGVWLMFAPSALGSSNAAADADHLVGALLVTFAVIAWGDVARTARYLNLLIGAWLVLGAWTLSGATALGTANDVAVGLALLALTPRRGRVTARFGTWDASIV
jgi:hypothetical protein